MAVNTTLDLTEFSQLTREHIDDSSVVDQVFETQFTLTKLKGMGVIRTGTVLPEYWRWPIKHSNPEGAQAVSRFQVVTAPAEDLFDQARLQPKEYMLPMSLPLEAVNENLQSEDRIANLLMETVNANLEAFGATLNIDFFNDGSNVKKIQGTRKFMGVDRTYAEINSTTYPVWDAIMMNTSTYSNYSATNLENPASAYFIGKLLSKATGLAEQKKINLANYLIICTPQFKESYKQVVPAILQIMAKDTKALDIGTNETSFRGIPMLSDVDCPSTSGSISHNYMLNTAKLEWHFGKQFDDGNKKGIYTFVDWQNMTNFGQNTIVGTLKCRTVLVCKQPGSQIDMECDGTTVGTLSA